MSQPAASSARLEEDFQIVRRNFPDVSRSVQSTSSSISTPKMEPNGRNGSSAGSFQGRAHEWSKEVLVRLERLESHVLQTQTANAERREECLSLAAQVAELRSAQTSAQLEAELRSGGNSEVSSLRADFEAKTVHLQNVFTTLQAQQEQSRLQLSEMQNEQSALRERQAARDGECASKIMELASCVDEVARQIQELKQDNLTETTFMRSRLEANTGDHDAHLQRLENLEVQQRDEQARLNTESAALKARLQALELRLAAAALEKISAQACSAHQAQEHLEVRMARLEAGLNEASKGVSSLPGATTTASRSASASVSVVSMEDSRSGLAHLVGEMDAELRVELNSRLRVLTADLKGEIMSEVAARLASAEASVSSIEAKLSSELDHVCEDFKICLESITKAQLVPRVKKLEDQMQSTKMLVATMQEAVRAKSESPQARDWDQALKAAEGHKEILRRQSMDRERSQDAPRRESEDSKAKVFMSTNLRQRLHGLVSALSWTLGQVQSEDPDVLDGSHTGSGKTPLHATHPTHATRRAQAPEPAQRRSSGVSGQSLRAGGGECHATDAMPSTTQSQDFKNVNRLFSVQNGTRGSPPPVTSARANIPNVAPQTVSTPANPANRNSPTAMRPWQNVAPASSVQAPVHPGGMADPRAAMQGRRPMTSMPASRGGSPPMAGSPQVGLAQRTSMQRQPLSASASPFPGGPRSPQLVLSQRPAVPGRRAPTAL